MSIRSRMRYAVARTRHALNSAVLKRMNHALVDNRILYEWQQEYVDLQPSYRTSSLPHGAAEYLVNNNPRLVELKARYAGFNNEVTAPLVWNDTYVRNEDILYFRGDNAYVWQVRESNSNIMAYALTTYYQYAVDKLQLVDKLREDDQFGIHTFTIDKRVVSRDLLDSITEINFLAEHVPIASHSNYSVLDIGAGYGRLAHRMVEGLPAIGEYLCTDAVPISTFISEYYLRFRKCDHKAKVVPLDEIDQALASRRVNLAVNVRSFSECKPAAIKWWLSLLAKHHVKYLMIAPNTGAVMRTLDGIDYQGIVEGAGYKLKVKEPKYADPVVQQFAISPTYHYLFELS